MVGGRDVNVPAAYQPHVPYTYRRTHNFSIKIYVNVQCTAIAKCSHQNVRIYVRWNTQHKHPHPHPYTIYMHRCVTQHSRRESTSKLSVWGGHRPEPEIDKTLTRNFLQKRYTKSIDISYTYISVPSYSYVYLSVMYMDIIHRIYATECTSTERASSPPTRRPLLNYFE